MKMIPHQNQEVFVYATSFFKILFFLLSCVYLLEATPIHWKYTNLDDETTYSKQPYIDMQKDIIKEIEEYLKLREPINIDTFIPPKITPVPYSQKVEPPREPESITLEKDTFETTEMFNKRLKKVQQKKQYEYEQELERYRQKVLNWQKKIDSINKEYAQKIENREQKIKDAQKIVKKDIAHLQKKYKKKLDKLSEKIVKISTKYLHKYFGNPQLNYLAYDADRAIMQLELSSDFNAYNQVVTIEIAPDKAKKIYENIYLAKPDIVFNIILDKEKDTVSLVYKKTVIDYDDEEYLASSSQDKLEQKPIIAKLSLNAPDKIESDFKPYRQHFTQREFVKPPMPSIEPKEFVISSFESDSLLLKLDREQAHAIDERKWLVVIGIEKYDMTDNIAYADNSAKAFYKIMKKRYGVTDENSFILLDKEASSGKISDLLSNLYFHVKADDSIYFYYNGHGLANPKEDNRAYILPVDRQVSYITSDSRFSLKNIYAKLLKTKAKSIFVFADTCFSGAVDNSSIYRGVASARIVAKNQEVDKSRMSVITAGRATQFSNKFDKKHHRLMSYYLLEAILNEKDNIFDIYKDVYKGVYKNSRKMGSIYLQEPQFFGNKKASL